MAYETLNFSNRITSILSEKESLRWFRISGILYYTLYSTLLAPEPLLCSTVPCTNLILGLGGQQLLELVLGELAEEILLDLHLLPIPLLVVLPQVPGAAPQQLLSMFPGYWYWPPIAAANIYPGIFNQIY